MKAQTTAISLLIIYAVLSQWAFRCQRVARGILLLAKDSASDHPELFSSIMPTKFVTVMWLKRGVWLAAVIFIWKSWRWYGVVPLAFYSIAVGVWIDEISPWPSYDRLLRLVKSRISSGAAGLQATMLLPTIHRVEDEMSSGVPFEDATTGVWLGRATEAAIRRNSRESPEPAGREDL